MVELEDPFVTSFAGMCELLLIRHAEPDYQDGLKIGEAGARPLTERGERQARAVAERLAPARLGAVYTSPLRRAFDTARAIAAPHGLEPIVCPELAEIQLWHRAPQDKTLLDLYSRAELDTIYAEWERTNRLAALPHCEDAEAFTARVVASLDRIAAASVGSRVAVVCHGGVINVYLSHLFQSGYDHLVSVYFTSITVVRAADTRRAVLTINDYAHVMPLERKPE
jgi:broad specificity phosphatase PhoE